MTCCLHAPGHAVLCCETGPSISAAMSVMGMPLRGDPWHDEAVLLLCHKSTSWRVARGRGTAHRQAPIAASEAVDWETNHRQMHCSEAPLQSVRQGSVRQLGCPEAEPTTKGDKLHSRHNSDLDGFSRPALPILPTYPTTEPLRPCPWHLTLHRALYSCSSSPAPILPTYVSIVRSGWPPVMRPRMLWLRCRGLNTSVSTARGQTAMRWFLHLFLPSSSCSTMENDVHW